MKNKKLLYILIPCTLLLWGMIIYKIFSVAGGDDDTFKSATFTPANINKTISDTFSIYPSYRDPFLGTTNKKTISTNENRTPKKIITPTIIKNTIPFPQITYGGLIKNTQSNKQLVMVQINGQSNIMKVGDIISEVELTKIFRDSIEVRFFKEKKFILK